MESYSSNYCSSEELKTEYSYSTNRLGISSGDPFYITENITIFCVNWGPAKRVDGPKSKLSNFLCQGSII